MAAVSMVGPILIIFTIYTNLLPDSFFFFLRLFSALSRRALVAGRRKSLQKECMYSSVRRERAEVDIVTKIVAKAEAVIVVVEEATGAEEGGDIMCIGVGWCHYSSTQKA